MNKIRKFEYPNQTEIYQKTLINDNDTLLENDLILNNLKSSNNRGLVRRMASSFSIQRINDNENNDCDCVDMKKDNSNYYQRFRSVRSSFSIPKLLNNNSKNDSTMERCNSKKDNNKAKFHLEETINGIQIQIKQPHLISVIQSDKQKNQDKTLIKIYPLKKGKTTVINLNTFFKKQKRRRKKF
jgi:hypothetical protein